MIKVISFGNIEVILILLAKIVAVYRRFSKIKIYKSSFKGLFLRFY